MNIDRSESLGSGFNFSVTASRCHNVLHEYGIARTTTQPESVIESFEQHVP